MADDNITAVKSHKMALDKGKARVTRFYSDLGFVLTLADKGDIF